MKFLLVLLTLIPLVVGLDIQSIADAQGRSISSQIVDAIEAAKLQMPCGFPGLGIPPLAPFKISHKELNIEKSSIKAFGEIEGFRMDGLNDFDILEFKVNAITSKINYKFNWNHVHLNTDYQMSSSVDSLDVKRTGTAIMALKNITVWGTIKYSLGVISGNVKLKSFDMYVTLDDVKSEIDGLSKYKIINKKLNQIIEEWIMLAINDNTENMSDLTNGHVVPLVNEMLGDMSLADLMRLIGGSGGSEGEDPVPCVPENK